MKGSWRFLVGVLFLAGFLVAGLAGTSTSMTFIWPGYCLLGVAGVASIGLLFREVSFSLPRWTTLATFAMVGYLLIRASESPVSYFAREDAALVVAALLCYGLFLSAFSDSAWRLRMMICLAALVIVNLGFALAQKLVSPGLWMLPGYERTFQDRVGGLFNHPDHFAGFLGVLAPLWASLALFGRSGRVVRVGWGLLSVVTALVVCLAQSGAAILGMSVGFSIVALATIGLVWRRIDGRLRRSAWAGLAGLVLIGLAIGMATRGPLSRQFDREILTRDNGASLPLVWEAGVKQFSESPLIGTGSRSSYYYSRLFRSEGLSSGVTDSEFAHNEYLQMLSDYGLVGLLLVSLVVFLHLSIGIRFVRAYIGFGSPAGLDLPRSNHLAMTLGAVAGIGSIAVLAVFDFVMHLPAFAIVAAVFLAILAAPDPMAAALKQRSPSVLPGGSLMLANRAAAFSGGLAMAIFGVIFTQSEYHYEKARLAFEADHRNFKQFRHLQTARSLDSKNPYALTLSAHAQVAGLTPELVGPERTQALEKADQYFTKARALYPQDIYAAVGHAAVLDELGRKSRARQRLDDARQWAPLYGNLMLAEAEHFLRHGEVAEAESAFQDARAARAFRDSRAADHGLKTISEWMLIAEENGIRWKDRVPANLEESPDRRSLPSARVEERAVAGEISQGGEGEPLGETAHETVPEPVEWKGE